APNPFLAQRHLRKIMMNLIFEVVTKYAIFVVDEAINWRKCVICSYDIGGKIPRDDPNACAAAGAEIGGAYHA
ncbi:MAG: hypothetical protein MJZ99_08855, partial [Bacteroidales bacterium]|nr:hypothetical protein [Bacteroidales bacterium]